MVKPGFLLFAAVLILLIAFAAVGGASWNS
jgi:hypothetical protein